MTIKETTRRKKSWGRKTGHLLV